MKAAEQSKDQKALLEKTRKDYYKRMGRNKYWKRGYEAAKKSKKIDENPYPIPDELQKLLHKRTLWVMGFEEYDMTYGKERRRKENKRLKSDVKVYDISKLESNGKWKEKKKHGKHKHKRKH